MQPYDQGQGEISELRGQSVLRCPQSSPEMWVFSPCLQHCTSACSFSHKRISTWNPLLHKIKILKMVPCLCSLQHSRLQTFLHHNLSISFCPDSLVWLGVAYEDQGSVTSHLISFYFFALASFKDPWVSFLRDLKHVLRIQIYTILRARLHPPV